jgi:hypothetical protein
MMYIDCDNQLNIGSLDDL